MARSANLTDSSAVAGNRMLASAIRNVLIRYHDFIARPTPPPCDTMLTKVFSVNLIANHLKTSISDTRFWPAIPEEGKSFVFFEFNGLRGSRVTHREQNGLPM